MTNQIEWGRLFAHKSIRENFIREILKSAPKTGSILFSGGFPYEGSFPREDLIRYFEKAVMTEGSMQYDATEGLMALRNQIAQDFSKKHGIEVSSNQVLITTGSQQALYLAGRTFIDPGDYVLVEKPSYIGALQAFDAARAQYAEVEMDHNGAVPVSLFRQIQTLQQRNIQPKFFYTIPDFHNPFGTQMSLKRRKEIIAIARYFQIPIIEDAPYSELQYEGKPVQPIYTLFPDGTIHLGSTSKTVAPGLRIGFGIMPESVLDRMAEEKQPIDLNTSKLLQTVFLYFLQKGYHDHLPVIRESYKPKRDAMVNALKNYFPSGFSFNHPKGGMFIWVNGPEQFNSKAMLDEAKERGVIYVPGYGFFANPNQGHNTMRLNFSKETPERIEEGIFILSKLLKKYTVNPAYLHT